MIFKRQKALLSTLLESKHPVPAERFKMLAAIISFFGPLPQPDMYDFFVLNKKINSILLDHEIEQLIQKGYIQFIDEDSFDSNLNKEALTLIYTLNFEEQKAIRKLVDQFRDKSEMGLLSYITKCIPDITPEIADQKPSIIATAGYEGSSIDSFLKKLLTNGIKTIIDVRKNPISRKFGFSKTNMKKSANSVGIEYLHFPELGIESESRKNLNSKDDYRKLFDKYEKTTLKNTVASQQVVIEQIGKQPSVLVCFEQDPIDCHRGRLANHLARQMKLPVIHL
ncbi:DUF488 domain-containing protein [Pseudodesulfovibrio indicus]|uniref:DUF488 domain-containing protein n=1 Tax=Pseudodesulfovibrio indicus TaxID=1716143 RepID=UPI00292CACFE|nr:DUF488 domain-containing protein [Pseudodesulfovibrio indicus]